MTNVLVLFLLQGCYNVKYFQSDTAQILDTGFMSGTQYHIVFPKVTVNKTGQYQFTFKYPPSCDLDFELYFHNNTTLEVIKDAQIWVRVVIANTKSNKMTFESQGELTLANPGQTGGWSHNNQSVFLPPTWEHQTTDGFLLTPGHCHLGASESYSLFIEFKVNDEDSSTDDIVATPLLQGGGGQTL